MRYLKIKPPARAAWLLVSTVAVGSLAACSGGAGPTAATGGTASAAAAATAPPSGPATSASVPMKVVSRGRATAEIVPVYVNGHGPYPLSPG